MSHQTDTFKLSDINLILIVSTPEYDAGVVSKTTNDVLHFLSHIR